MPVEFSFCYHCNKKCNINKMNVIRTDVYANFEQYVSDIVKVLKDIRFCKKCYSNVCPKIKNYIAIIYEQFGENINVHDAIVFSRVFLRGQHSHFPNMFETPNMNNLDGASVLVDHLGIDYDQISKYNIFQTAYASNEPFSHKIMRYFMSEYDESFLGHLRQFIQIYVDNILELVMHTYPIKIVECVHTIDEQCDCFEKN